MFRIQMQWLGEEEILVAEEQYYRAFFQKEQGGASWEEMGGMEASPLSCLYEKKPVYPWSSGCGTNSGKMAWSSYD